MELTPSNPFTGGYSNLFDSLDKNSSAQEIQRELVTSSPQQEQTQSMQQNIHQPQEKEAYYPYTQEISFDLFSNIGDPDFFDSLDENSNTQEIQRQHVTSSPQQEQTQSMRQAQALQNEQQEYFLQQQAHYAQKLQLKLEQELELQQQQVQDAQKHQQLPKSEEIAPVLLELHKQFVNFSIEGLKLDLLKRIDQILREFYNTLFARNAFLESELSKQNRQALQNQDQEQQRLQAPHILYLQKPEKIAPALLKLHKQFQDSIKQDQSVSEKLKELNLLKRIATIIRGLRRDIYERCENLKALNEGVTPEHEPGEQKSIQSTVSMDTPVYFPSSEEFRVVLPEGTYQAIDLFKIFYPPARSQKPEEYAAAYTIFLSKLDTFIANDNKETFTIDDDLNYYLNPSKETAAGKRSMSQREISEQSHPSCKRPRQNHQQDSNYTQELPPEDQLQYALQQQQLQYYQQFQQQQIQYALQHQQLQYYQQLHEQQIQYALQQQLIQQRQLEQKIPPAQKPLQANVERVIPNSLSSEIFTNKLKAGQTYTRLKLFDTIYPGMRSPISPGRKEALARFTSELDDFTEKTGNTILTKTHGRRGCYYYQLTSKDDNQPTNDEYDEPKN